MTAEVDEETPEAGRVDSPRRRTLAWIMIGAGTVILLATAWVGWRTYEAYRSLQAAAGQVGALQRQFDDPGRLGPGDDRRAIITSLQANAASARSAVDDPVYRLATGVPFVGPNLDALRQVSLTVSSLSTDVIPSLDDIARTLDPSALTPKEGAVDLAPIVAIAPQLQKADGAVQDARAQLGGIDPSSVVTPVGEAVAALRSKLDAAASLTGPAARIARLLPAALGSDGPRTYLVVFQNLAEPRSTGGIFGSYAILTADQGKVLISDQGPARTMRMFDPPVADLADEQRQLFGTDPATYPADVNLTPDFPTAAQLFIDMYRARGGSSVDGVVAVDPVALSYLLKGSPALDVDGTIIDADNFASMVLSTAYERFGDADHDPRDDFLAGATAAAFAQVTSGSADPGVVAAGVRRAAGERRLLLFSTHDTEQADIAATGLSGALDGSSESSGIGLFLNDAVGSKLGYYLTEQTTVTGGQCQADGSQLVAVTTTINYQPPSSGAPDYVNGKSPDGSYRVHVLLTAPTGGRIDAAEVDGQPASLRMGTQLNRPSGIAVVELKPDASATLSFYLTIPPGTSAPTVSRTPTIDPWPVTMDGLGCRQ